MQSPGLYDLVLPSADYGGWAGKPLRSIILCSHPRSGSTLLGEAMRFAGDLGCPLEYLHRGFRPRLAELWDQPALPGYIAEMHRRRTCANGTFAIKLFWQDIEEVACEAAPGQFPPPRSRMAGTMTPQDYRALAALLHDILPNPTYIHLTRRDRLRQAISSVIATQTGLWRAIPDVGRQSPVAEPTFDYDAILSAFAFGEHSHNHWQAYFAANSIMPETLIYEDFMGDYQSVTESLLRRLGSTATKAPPARMQRQASATNEAFLLRFLAEHARRSAADQATSSNP